MFLVAITDREGLAAHEFRPIVHRNHRVWSEPLNEKEKERFIGYLQRIQPSPNSSED